MPAAFWAPDVQKECRPARIQACAAKGQAAHTRAGLNNAVRSPWRGGQALLGSTSPPPACPGRRPRPLPPTAPARCRGGGSGGRSPLREGPLRLRGGFPPWPSTRCATLDAPRDPNAVSALTAPATGRDSLPCPRPSEPLSSTGTRVKSRTRAGEWAPGCKVHNKLREGRGIPRSRHPFLRLWATRTAVTGDVGGRIRPLVPRVRDCRDGGASEAVQCPHPSHGGEDASPRKGGR